MEGYEFCLGIPGRTTFGLNGVFSVIGRLERPLGIFWVFCLLGARIGSSSSSLLNVRSTTWLAGLLLLECVAGPEEVEGSLEEIGGVDSMPASRLTSRLTEVTCGGSWISIRSSSSPLLRCPLLGLGVFPTPVVVDHFPFGSMVT